MLALPLVLSSATSLTNAKYFFAGDENFPLLIEQLVIEAPTSLSPMGLITYGLETSAARLQSQHKYLQTRRAVIQTDEGLHERELRKRATLAEAIRRGFLVRGYDELNALLAAQLCVTIFGITLDRWLDQDDEQALPQLLHETFRAFRSITAEK